MKLLFIAFIIMFFIKTGDCLLFDLYRDEKSCFYDDYMQGTVIVVNYKLSETITRTLSEIKRLNIALYNYDEGQLVTDRNTIATTGKFSHLIEKSINLFI